MKMMTLRRTTPCALVLFFSVFLPRVTTEAATVTYQLREEQGSGTFVGNIERDMLLQGELEPQDAHNLKYTLSTTGKPQALLFVINETTSTITTSQRLDREEVCPGKVQCLITLSVPVYRRSETSASLELFRLWIANVNINDINDNSPAFPQPYVTLSVPESVPPGHVLHTSGAEDKDKGGTNSVKEYTLSPSSDLFSIDPRLNPDGSSDLGIVVLEALDREKQASYQLRVVVVDGGYPQRTGALTVNITVADINDERPTFAKGTYNVTVRENVLPNVPIVRVSATDLDVGLNGDVTYSFSPRVDADVRRLLQIDPTSGSVSARGPIDFEEKNRYQFLVEAQDKGSPPLSGGTLVILRVEDVNDNAPQININLTPGGNNLTEDEAVGKFIAHVSVSDRDSGENAAVICSMDDDHFSLQKFYKHAVNMFKVVLSQALDYETTRAHRLTITCRDNGVPVLANSTSFVVHVRDVNDNAPRFSMQTYTASVIENHLDVEDLLQVSAVDYDTGAAGEVDYAMDASTPNVSRIFALHPVTGVLQVRSPLNREDRGRYVFHVLAFDNGTPRMSSSATVVVTVQDVNDQKPYFTRSLFDCYVLERQPAGTRVGNVTAQDADSSEHSAMLFTLVQGVGDDSLFRLDPRTGVLTSAVVLDREARALYRLQVKVEDPNVSLFYDLANVTVQVLDDNDNPPLIHYPREGNNSINVSYGTMVGWVLAQVNATDGDEGPFGQLSYYIADGNPTHLFDLHQRSGRLSLARTTLPGDVQEHTLELQVQDGGNPPLFRNVDFHVNIVAGNMTLTLMSPSENQDHNMLIVIVLVCVTVVLALAVLITICLIRRIDRERTARREASKAAEEEKMFHLKTQNLHQQDAFMSSSAPSPDSSSGVSDTSSSNNGGGGGGGAKNSMMKKKEVSFSIDEGVDSLNTSGGSGHHPLSTFKAPPPLENGPGNYLSVNSPPLRNDPGMLNIPVGHRLSADDNHLHSVPEEESCHYINMLKRGTGHGEDALSESSGETGTSDSGRGGSEDDSHSNRGSATIDPDGPAVYPNVFLRSSSAAPSSGLDTYPANRGRHPQPLHHQHQHHHYGSGRSSLNSGVSSSSAFAAGRPLRQHSPHVSFSGNLEYLGESSTDNLHHHPHHHYDPSGLHNSGGGGGFPPPPDLVSEASPPPPPAPIAETNFSTFGGGGGGQSHLAHSPRGNTNTNPNNSNSHNSYRSVLFSHPGGGSHHGYGGVSIGLVKNFGGGAPSPTISTTSPAPSPLALEGCGRQQRWGSPSFLDDDDNRTLSSTTSGSYVINPEDLRKEIDDLILNDMIV